MAEPLILALPSKGRLKEQAEAWLADCGLPLTAAGGATEGAPAAGAAELVVDITTSGATLAANSLKVVSDGVILKSQAQLAASLRGDWDAARMAACRRLLGIVEARARGRTIASLVW